MSCAPSLTSTTSHVLVRRRVGFNKSHQKRGVDSFGGCPPAHFPESGHEEAVPVTTESRVFLSEVTKTHRKTSAFRGDGQGLPAPWAAGVWAECQHRPPGGWPHRCPVLPGGLDSLTSWLKGRFPECGVEGGCLWRSLECPCAAGQCLLLTPSLPVHCMRSPRLKMTCALVSVHGPTASTEKETLCSPAQRRGQG